MRPRHLRGVMAIEEAVYPHPWSRRLFASEIRRREDRRYLVALGLRRWWWRPVLGYAGIILQAAEAHVATVAVHPSMRRRRIGTLLVARALEEAAALGATAATLEVRETNVGAQRLYERFGFAAVGIRPGYYGEPGEDALIMWLHDLPGRRVSGSPLKKGEG
jgi:[ribosomal protein S18]-alanine N-acetyltransferase